MSTKSAVNDIGRNGSSESHENNLRSRSSSYDDESLKFLTHEEKDVLMFFEETIDAFEDEEKEDLTDYNDNFVVHAAVQRRFEEHGLNHCDNEDIIDLVQPKTTIYSMNIDLVQPKTTVYSTNRVPYDNILPDHGKNSEADKSQAEESSAVSSDNHISHDFDGNIQAISPIRDSTLPPDDTKDDIALLKNSEKYLPESSPDSSKPNIGQHLGFVPTPVVVAQSRTEKTNERPSSQVFSKSPKVNEHTWSPPFSPPHGLSHGRDFSFRQSPHSPPKLHRFPDNINVTVTGKEYNTIAKAAVKVQERRAQVLANLNGAGFLSPEWDEKAHRSMVDGRVRSASLRDQAVDHSWHESSSNLGLAREAAASPKIRNHIPISSTPKATHSNHLRSNSHEYVSNSRENVSSPVKGASYDVLPTTKSVVFRPDSESAENTISHSTTSQNLYTKSAISAQDIQKACSLPRLPTGLRPQGITVQFLGRGASEESRREALKKLGLLKST